MSNELVGSQGGAWDSSTHETLYPQNFNHGLAEFIVKELKPNNVLEFGSGLGILSKYINDNAKSESYYCIEPNYIEGSYDNVHGPKLLPLDIFNESHPHVLNYKFDLVLSIEVAEHIEIEKHEELFDFLVAHTKKWIVFSGARVGQGGLGHIAERAEEEWRHEFVKRGMVYEKGLTNSIRLACDKENINHKRNVMVFKRPSYLTELDQIESVAKPYLTDLLAIIQSRSKYLDGNLFYVYLQDAINGMPHDSLKVKRDNFINLIKNKRNILEIGFNAGHSILLALLVNDKVKITVIDTCQHTYTESCFFYLNRLFPGRISLKKGNSVDVLSELNGERFDFIHYDGGKEKTIQKDIELTRDLVANDHVLVIDDMQNKKLNNIVLELEKNEIIDLSGYCALTQRLKNYKWKHAIATFIKEDNEAGVGFILNGLKDIYNNDLFPSIYTNNVNTILVTGFQRASSLIHIIKDINNKCIPGAFVECGVAAGHSSVIASLILKALNNNEISLYLYDTYNGFCFDLPEEKDINETYISEYDLDRYQSEYTTEEAVYKNLLQTGIKSSRIEMVKGLVEDTVPGCLPDKISVLRLDVDLYKPTLHCLQHMYPLLQVGGYLIIDDYGHWSGCKKAVDEYFDNNNMNLQDLVEIDYTCRVYIKLTS